MQFEEGNFDDFSDYLATVKSFDENFSCKVSVNSKLLIEAKHVIIENDELAYCIAICNKENNEIIDSIYSDVDIDSIDDAITFLVEEYDK